jgi:uncharacterized protein
MADPADFLELERAFAAHLRDPAHNPAPEGIEDRRLKIYRDLFLNNVRNLLGGTFKLTRKLIGEAAWIELVREFYTSHPCRTPIFLELPGEFREWLAEERGLRDGDPPFMLELAHYEWVDLALNFADAEDDAATIDANGDLLDGHPVVSSLAWPLAYRFPVHRISPDFRPSEAPAVPTFLVVHRDVAHQIQFSEINGLAARLLELLDGDGDLTGRQALTQIATEIEGAEVDAVLKQGTEILGRLVQEGIVLGARKG